MPSSPPKNGQPRPPAASHIVLTRGDRGLRPRLSTLEAADLWRSSAPGPLRAAWRAEPEQAGWGALRQVLLAGRSDLSADEASFGDPRLWGVGGELEAFCSWLAETRQMSEAKPSISPGGKKPRAKEKGKKKTKSAAAETSAELTDRVAVWLDSADKAEPTIAYALECVAWAYALPGVARRVAGDTWWRLAEHLDATATTLAGARPREDAGTVDMTVDQLLGGELPLVLSAVLPDAKPWRLLGKQAYQTLTEGVLAWTDGEGLPPGRALPGLGLIAACWTRCRRLADRANLKCWDAAAQTQYEWLVRQLVRLADRRGRLPLSGPTEHPGLIAAALECAGDDVDQAAAVARFGASKRQGLSAKPPRVAPPDPAVNSEWSGASLLAAGWGKKDARLLATYDGAASQVAVNNLGEPLLAGDWRTSIAVDGAPVAVADDWQEVCWFSDEDCDYLEYEAELEGGGRLERVVMLAKQDAAAMLVDLVHTGAKDRVAIEVETRLPLAPGLRFEPEQETRDGWIGDARRPLAGVLPLAMAEWRIEPLGGELTGDGGQLRVRHEAVGRAIACPVWLDLKPKRFAKQRTWRRLTVAESLRPVDRDVAVGFRVQAGKDQWLFYRSLAAKANRTVLGQNYSSETFFGRFQPSTGLAEEYFEVEA